MTWRTVVVTNKAKLSYKNDYLIVRNDEVKLIHLSEINTLIIDTTAATMTSYLISEMLSRKIKIIICDKKRNPQGEIVPYYGSHNTSEQIFKQIEWDDYCKTIWTRIIEEKIINQANYLKELEIDSYKMLYDRPLNEFRFQAFLALNMTVTENGFAYMKITKEMINEYEVDAGSASNMVNNFNFIKEIIAWSFVSYDEKQELYKVNIRSRGPVINEIAQQFNGGGHKFASGARIKNADDIDRLFKALDDACKTYKETNL